MNLEELAVMSVSATTARLDAVRFSVSLACTGLMSQPCSEHGAQQPLGIPAGREVCFGAVPVFSFQQKEKQLHKAMCLRVVSKRLFSLSWSTAQCVTSQKLNGKRLHSWHHHFPRTSPLWFPLRHGGFKQELSVSCTAVPFTCTHQISTAGDNGERCHHSQSITGHHLVPGSPEEPSSVPKKLQEESDRSLPLRLTSSVT